MGVMRAVAQLTVCEIKIEVAMELRELNLKGQPTKGNSGSYGNDKPVDGITNVMNLGWGQCGHYTGANKAPAWWGVDLGANYNGRKLTLYNRNDCCPFRLTDVKIFLGESWDSYSSNTRIASDIDVPQHAPLAVSVDASGQYLWVMRAVAQLTVCEIKIEVAMELRELNLKVQPTKGNSGSYGNDKPVDGITNVMNLGWGQCGHYTGANKAPAWWGVDLGANYNVRKLTLY